MYKSCIIWCKRYIYALLEKDERIIQTKKEIQQLQGIEPSKWKTLVGNRLRIKFNLLFLGLSIVSNMILLIQGNKSFVQLSNKLNKLFDTNEYSILQINDYIQFGCMVVGFLSSLYAVYHWTNVKTTNKFIIVSWISLLLSSLVLILIPPYYFLRVYSRLSTDFTEIYDYITNDDISSDPIQTTTLFDSIQILIQIAEVYTEILINSFTIVILLPFMFRNNTIQMRDRNKTYSKIASILHITLSIIEVFVSVIIFNICILFQFDNYIYLISCVILYNIWKQSQYVLSVKYTIVQNIFLFVLCVVGGVYIVILEINIYNFVSNFLISYFINKLAIQTIIQEKHYVMTPYMMNTIFGEDEYELFVV